MGNFLDYLESGIFHKLSTAIISGPRLSGKTIAILQAANNDTNACIVCSSVQEQRRLINIAKEHNYDVEIITFKEFTDKKFIGSEIKSFYFDDIDKILRGVAYPRKIKMISIDSSNIINLSANENNEE